MDVVLNALAGEAIPMGLSCLAEFGRFIEIGKRDIYQNSRIPLWPLRRNASFHVVAMDAVFRGDEALTRQDARGDLPIWSRRARFARCPFAHFRQCRIDAAFRLMAGGKHIGKVVVAFADPFVPRRGEPLAPGFQVKPDGSYLITGGVRRLRQSPRPMAGRIAARAISFSRSRSGASTSGSRRVRDALAGPRRRSPRRAGGHWFA